MDRMPVTMSPACSQAVALPEIVAAILEQMPDTKALWPALQVNRLWADEATTLLWREYPSITDLNRIEDVKRIQYYADKISCLRLTCEGDKCKDYLKLQSLRFPRLRQLNMYTVGCRHEQLVLQNLQPMLRTFESFGEPISKDCLMQIQARCPALRDIRLGKICLDNSIDVVPGDVLLTFLKGMPSLTSIHLGKVASIPEDSMLDEVFAHLASRPNLASFKSSYHELTLKSINTMQQVIDQPFSELVDLSCSANSEAFRQFSRDLRRVTKLNLYMFEIARNTVSDLCSCTSLVYLELTFQAFSDFDAKSHLSAEKLLALAKSCSHLQGLSVWHMTEYEVRDGYSNINDDVIRGLVALLPELRCFRLRFPTYVTQQALRIFGKGCVRMQECALRGKLFNLRLLESSGSVLFPRLEELDLTPAAEGHSAAEIAKIFHHHAPRVTTMYIGDSYKFGEEVMEEIRELRRQNEVQSLEPVL